MDITNAIKEQRKLIIDVSYRAKQGHLSSSMSILEMLNVLYRRINKFDSQHPNAIYNDKVVLSKDHASLAVYSLLFQLGILTKEQLYSFSQFDSIVGEIRRLLSVETRYTTGSIMKIDSGYLSNK